MKIILAGSLTYFEAIAIYLAQHVNENYKPILIFHAGKINEPLSSFMEERHIPIIGIRSLNDEYEEKIRRLEPDLLICVGFPEILNPRIFNIPKLGTINLHTSALPKYRGRHPMNWQLINGEKEIGITVHFIDDGIDSGDIILQDSIPIHMDDDLNDLHTKCLPIAINILIKAIEQIENGTVYRRKQNINMASYLPLRTPKDSIIDWKKTGFELHRFINALVDPMPNAFAYLMDGRLVYFKRSYRSDDDMGIGRVLGKTKDGKYIITTPEGVILVDIVMEDGSVLIPGDKFDFLCE